MSTLARTITHTTTFTAARVATALSLLIAAILVPSPARAAGTYFTGAYVSVYGARDFHGYVPSAYRSGTPMPLLVALHGCTENDVGFDVLSGWSSLAERRGFIVVFPDQSNLVNPAGCWNWFLGTNQHRGWGEPALIAGITNTIRGRYTVDPRRIYVTGVSAGGVMANIMAVTYPDIYAAAAIFAGCEYACDPLRIRTPEESGQEALREMGSRRRAVPVIIWQGTADIVVHPETAYRIAGQWATIDAIDTIPDSVQTGQAGRTYTRLIYHNANGQPLIEQVMIDGAGHSYPGGCACSLYGDPSGPDGSGMSWSFFLAHPKP